MQVPVANLWLLQLFASAMYERQDVDLADVEAAPEDLPELATRILVDEVGRRLRMGMTTGFEARRSRVTRVRGRVNHLPTERGQLLLRGQVDCTFDRLTADVPPTRLARAALRRGALLVDEPHLAQSMASRLESLGVTGPAPRLSEIPAMISQRAFAADARMIAAAELLLSLAIPTETDGGRRLPTLDIDDHRLRRLFERAAFGLFRHRLGPCGWAVRHATKQRWDVQARSAGLDEILPIMELDIVLSSPSTADQPSRRIVVDTKFTGMLRDTRYASGKLRSEYLYQMFSYLLSQSRSEAEGSLSEGLLLHPVVNEEVDEEFWTLGRRLRFCTVDLRQAPRDVVSSFLRATTLSDITPTVPT